METPHLFFLFMMSPYSRIQSSYFSYEDSFYRHIISIQQILKLLSMSKTSYSPVNSFTMSCGGFNMLVKRNPLIVNDYVYPRCILLMDRWRDNSSRMSSFQAYRLSIERWAEFIVVPNLLQELTFIFCLSYQLLKSNSLLWQIYSLLWKVRWAAVLKCRLLPAYTRNGLCVEL